MDNEGAKAYLERRRELAGTSMQGQAGPKMGPTQDAPQKMQVEILDRKKQARDARRLPPAGAQAPIINLISDDEEDEKTVKGMRTDSGARAATSRAAPAGRQHATRPTIDEVPVCESVDDLVEHLGACLDVDLSGGHLALRPGLFADIEPKFVSWALDEVQTACGTDEWGERLVIQWYRVRQLRQTSPLTWYYWLLEALRLRYLAMYGEELVPPIDDGFKYHMAVNWLVKDEETGERRGNQRKHPDAPQQVSVASAAAMGDVSLAGTKGARFREVARLPLSCTPDGQGDGVAFFEPGEAGRMLAVLRVTGASYGMSGKASGMLEVTDRKGRRFRLPHSPVGLLGGKVVLDTQQLRPAASVMFDAAHSKASMDGEPLPLSAQSMPSPLPALPPLPPALTHIIRAEPRVTGGPMSVYLHTREHCQVAGRLGARGYLERLLRAAGVKLGLNPGALLLSKMEAAQVALRAFQVKKLSAPPSNDEAAMIKEAEREEQRLIKEFRAALQEAMDKVEAGSRRGGQRGVEQAGVYSEALGRPRQTMDQRGQAAQRAHQQAAVQAVHDDSNIDQDDVDEVNAAAHEAYVDRTCGGRDGRARGGGSLKRILTISTVNPPDSKDGITTGIKGGGINWQSQFQSGRVDCSAGSWRQPLVAGAWHDRLRVLHGFKADKLNSVLYPGNTPAEQQKNGRAFIFAQLKAVEQTEQQAAQHGARPQRSPQELEAQLRAAAAALCSPSAPCSSCGRGGAGWHCKAMPPLPHASSA